MKITVQTGFLCFIFAGMVAAVSPATAGQDQPKDPKSLIEKAVEAVGTLERLRSLKDVEYVYVYNDASGKLDVSTERYVFDGELSWARYTVHDKHVFPGHSGVVIQGYNGQESWATIDGTPAADPDALKQTRFMRKTNYYWFTMMFKLLDPGIAYSYEGTRRVEGVNYDVVKMTFGPGVGDIADIYVLYLNPQTHLVDQFLFTVMDFGMAEPLLMKVSYEEIQGLKLPTRRSYGPSDWDGQAKPGPHAEELSVHIRFNNGFSPTLFDKP